MKLIFVIIFYLQINRQFLLNVNCVVWLRPKNERGPAAVVAGLKCLQQMIHIYFNDPLITRTKNMLILHTNNMTSPAAEIEIKILELMHTIIANGTIEGFQLRIISDNYVRDTMETTTIDDNLIIRTDYYVFVVDNFEKFQYNLQNYVTTKSSSWTPGGKFIILFNNPDLRSGSKATTTVTPYDIAEKFIQLMHIDYTAANLIILVATGITKYNIYIPYPYTSDSDCDILKPLLIDVCNDEKIKYDYVEKFIRKSELFEIIPSCQLTVCARVTQPYVEDNCEQGLEIGIINVIQSVMKFRLNLICSKLDRGEFINDTWTNLLGMLRNNTCDIVVGGIYPDNEIHADFDVTLPYLSDSFTWFVHLAKLRDPWKGLIVIFKTETWLLLDFILILSGLSWYFFGKTMPEKIQHKNLSTCMLNAWSVFIGLSANNIPKRTPLRVFFIILALYSLNVTTIYTSKLITVFTQPSYDSQLKTIQNIIDKGLPIGGLQELQDWFENNNNKIDQQIYKLYKSTEQFKPSTENLLRIRDGHQAMLLNRAYVLSHHLRNDLYAIKGNVFSNQMEMVAERGYPILQKFNKIINYMKNAGLFTKIYQDFVYNMTVLAFIKDREHIKLSTQIVVLTTDHLQGAFAVIILGLLISIIVFIIEIISTANGYLKLKLNINQWWNRFMIKLKLKDIDNIIMLENALIIKKRNNKYCARRTRKKKKSIKNN